MMTCKEAAKFVSEGKDHELPWQRRLGLRMHLAMCKLCRRYRTQLEMISKISVKAGEMIATRLPFGVPAENFALSTTSKQRIKEKIAQSQQRD